MNTNDESAVQPRWVLDEEYGINIDPLNWILMARSRNKQGEPTGWRPVGYYPSSRQLLESLARRLSRVSDTGQSLPEHLEAAFQRVAEAGRKLASELDALNLARGVPRACIKQ